MAAFIRMSKIKKTLVITMVLYMLIFLFYIGIGFISYYNQRSAFDDFDTQYRVAVATEDFTNYEFVKKERSYQMGVKTRAENRFKDNSTWAVMIMAIGGAVYTLLFYTIGKQPAKKEYRRAEDYPFNPVHDEECEKEGRYN